jgi:hypothetical protein
MCRPYCRSRYVFTVGRIRRKIPRYTSRVTPISRRNRLESHLRNELVLSARLIGFWEDVDRECVPAACDQEAGKCGYIAWELAADLRRRYHLGAFGPKQTSYDILSVLKPLHEKALREAKERSAMRAKRLAEKS